MKIALIALVAFLASGLTFFTGFGLGTLLLPTFSLFFPVPIAVGLTAIVHFLNGLFKVALLRRHVDLRTAFRFGIPALIAAFAGARLLAWLGEQPPLGGYVLGSRRFEILPVKLVVAGLMIGFALLELRPRMKSLSLPTRYLPLGGLLSGFFGGLSGHQGAFRSIFLLRVGLRKEAFVATGAAVAAGVDLTRLGVYARTVLAAPPAWGTVIVAVGSAFAGAVLGSRLLDKVSLRAIERGVSALLVLIGLGLAAGLL